MIPLDIQNAHAHYDSEARIVYVTYHGLLNAETSTTVYHWLHELMLEQGSETVYGEIWDFRDVQEFLPDNLMDARKKSRGLNLRISVDFPVAMVVKDFYQEEILRGPMQNVPENTRKSIVRTMNDAHQFLAEWHASQQTQQDDAEPLADSQ
jgi:hypothetical protein